MRVELGQPGEREDRYSHHNSPEALLSGNVCRSKILALFSVPSSRKSLQRKRIMLLLLEAKNEITPDKHNAGTCCSIFRILPRAGRQVENNRRGAKVNILETASGFLYLRKKDLS